LPKGVKSSTLSLMTLKEQLHAKIEQADEGTVAKWLELLEALEEDQAKDDHAETIALWEALAEPINDEAAEREFAEAVKRRPFFGESGFIVRPD
jgi:hypothetical protein